MNKKTKQLLTEIIEILYYDCETLSQSHRVYDELVDLIGEIDLEQTDIYCINSELKKNVCNCSDCIDRNRPDYSEQFIN